jgi:hypothetical protein
MPRLLPLQSFHALYTSGCNLKRIFFAGNEKWEKAALSREFLGPPRFTGMAFKPSLAAEV